MKQNISNSSAGENGYKKGFLSEYAKTDIEEDFNVFSGLALTYPEWMLQLANEHKAIGNKLRVWLNFYETVSDKYTEFSYFKSFKKAVSN